MRDWTRQGFAGFPVEQSLALRAAADFPVPVLTCEGEWLRRLWFYHLTGHRCVRLAPGEYVFSATNTLGLPPGMTVVGSGQETVVRILDGLGWQLPAGATLEKTRLVVGRVLSGQRLTLGEGSCLYRCLVELPEPSVEPDAVVCLQKEGASVIGCSVTFGEHRGCWDLHAGALVSECDIFVGAGRGRDEDKKVLNALEPTVRVLGNRFLWPEATDAFVAAYLCDGSVMLGNDCGFDAGVPGTPKGIIMAPTDGEMVFAEQNIALLSLY